MFTCKITTTTCQYPEGPATGHLDTGFAWFPFVYKQTLRWFPRFEVATTCFSCSPPDLNLLVATQLQFVIIIIIIIIYRWGAGLLVTGRLRDIGQNVLRSSFERGRSSSGHSYCQIFLLMAFFDEVFF